MRSFSNNSIRKVLKQFGLKPQSGNGSGHEVWATAEGRRCYPVLRHKDISEASVYALGQHLEGIGLCQRKQFMDALKAA